MLEKLPVEHFSSCYNKCPFFNCSALSPFSSKCQDQKVLPDSSMLKVNLPCENTSMFYTDYLPLDRGCLCRYSLLSLSSVLFGGVKLKMPNALKSFALKFSSKKATWGYRVILPDWIRGASGGAQHCLLYYNVYQEARAAVWPLNVQQPNDGRALLWCCSKNVCQRGPLAQLIEAELSHTNGADRRRALILLLATFLF